MQISKLWHEGKFQRTTGRERVPDNCWTRPPASISWRVAVQPLTPASHMVADGTLIRTNRVPGKGPSAPGGATCVSAAMPLPRQCRAGGAGVGRLPLWVLGTAPGAVYDITSGRHQCPADCTPLPRPGWRSWPTPRPAAAEYQRPGPQPAAAVGTVLRRTWLRAVQGWLVHPETGAQHFLSSGPKAPSSQGWSIRVARSDCSLLASHPWSAPLSVILVIAETSIVTTGWSGSSLCITR